MKLPAAMVKEAHLKTPNFERAGRFPQMDKEGKNKALQFDLTVILHPSKDKTHKLFVDEIIRQEKELITQNPDILRTVIKPKYTPKLENGVKVRDSKGNLEFDVVPDEFVLNMMFRDQVLVTEKGKTVEGDNLLLDYKTMITGELNIYQYKFIDEEGKTVSGLKVTPLELEVLSRPARKSDFSKIAKGK